MRGTKGAGFALFGETVIVGVLVALLSVPLVTALPALAAGSTHMRRHVSGESARTGDLLRDFTAAWRGLWPAALVGTGLGLLLLWNLTLAEAGVIPGSAGVLAGSAGLLALLSVLMLRTAGAWRPGCGPVGAVRTAAARTWRDPSGSVLLVLAAGMCLVFGWMLLPLLLLAGGLLVLAVVAVEHRRPA
ncbi:hypothetical protein PJ985_13760 [Streptomyces sp. ACA25]|uniref:hypothetical protein n=1 Tax=Streptomyces sp. ACA25 TaxID=3022596 RepID=UPI00230728B3|nr:hypothetical protein [Streptomyces sp. ACA25]MDB1088634.1 hypothetical protein [Streptomyces sp. ACA25]